jgi:catechol 2,3-dioxygenase-like lactoylglutathione lyase family enzyme
MFRQVFPVLPVRDIARSCEFYASKLGFSVYFKIETKPGYARVGRDDVEIHLQWHDPEEWKLCDRPMLRFMVEDVDALFDEYKDKGVFHERTALRDTPWGTREFAFFDPDRNGLTFFRDS